jgi:hypothetical protein
MHIPIKLLIAAPVGGDITSKVSVYNDNYNKEYAENCVYSTVSTISPCFHCERSKWI